MKIKQTDQLFLEALKASLQQKSVDWESEWTKEEWLALFQTAEKHKVLPMIYEAVFRCPAAQALGLQNLAPFKQHTVRSVMLQTMKTNEFYCLFQHLQSSGVTPLVVKGIICRSLYPQPDYRISGDEDVLIPREQFELCHKAMLEYGMQLSNPDQDIHAVYEVSYGKPGSPLYIELHKSLFPPDSDAYGELNHYFERVYEQAIEMPVDGIPITTMGYTDHLFYLICHAFKHFLHSGVGIRQICDITLFANSYGRDIDWMLILEQCQEIHADLFAAALFQIGQKYLTFDPDQACYPIEWKNIQVDEIMLLMDLLDAGIYGDGSMSRKHSSNITLDAVSSQKQGKKTRNGVIASLFPSLKKMEGRYPYLKQHPYLLPVAWGTRILKYRKETKQGQNNDASSAVSIGNQRLELLKEYRILDNK
ncbi:nucleotidyltransferase domain-containing protein [Bariatricus sp. HCP28S3_D3]|uniref:nucleotidyltransferase domain-containing protein n=1 Tax=Bariatricus sp. HCP28S3_D3 TaxID=3438901 RepID=UPI003F8BA981